MSIIQRLFWEKYRPTSEKGLILLPRIKKLVDEGIQLNMIFYGTSGTGKSTLANILSDKFSFIKINASLDNGIDVLRETIDNYITKLDFSANNKFKIIYLDEFDKASSLLQNALKAYIEKYEERVRFIFTTNHIHNIIPELRSRFCEVPFDPINKTEREYLQKNYSMYLRAIAKKEGSDIYTNVELFDKIVKKSFPDLRKSTIVLQEILISGDVNFSGGACDNGIESLYLNILDKNIEPIHNYDFVMDNYFTNFDEAFAALGRPFFEYLKEMHTDIVMSKGGAIIKTQGEYYKCMGTVPDPIIHLINFIISLKECIR